MSSDKDSEIKKLREELSDKLRLLNDLKGIRWIRLPKRIYELEEEIKDLSERIKNLQNG